MRQVLIPHKIDYCSWAKFSNENKLARAFVERPEINTTFAVGFLHMDAKEVFERARESSHT